MARAIRVDEHGGPEVMKLEPVEVPEPGPGEATVQHRAIGVNFIDTYHRTGLYPIEPPHGIGMEASGVITATGKGVTDLEPGDRVAYAAGPPGAYAEERNIAAGRLVPLPNTIDDERAAAMMLKGMTVEYLIRRTFEVREGMTVLFHAAAGGVGLIACQWLASLGVTVIGTVGSDEKAELARENGCHHPVVYTADDFVEQVRKLTNGAGVPVVYDSVGKATFARSLECLSPRGMLVSFGNASGAPEPLDPLELSRRGSLYLTRPSLMTYTESREELLESGRALFEVVASGAVKIEVRQRFPLADAENAHKALESRATTGSTILQP